MHLLNFCIKYPKCFDNTQLRSGGKIIRLRGEHYMTENSFENPDNIIIEEREIQNIEAPGNSLFLPHSVTILEYNKVIP